MVSILLAFLVSWSWIEDLGTHWRERNYFGNWHFLNLYTNLWELMLNLQDIKNFEYRFVMGVVFTGGDYPDETFFRLFNSMIIKSPCYDAIHHSGLIHTEKIIRKCEEKKCHAINKRIEGVVPDLTINGIPLDRVQTFNFLGILLNENMSWKPHIDLLSNKLAKCAGVLNQLKHFLTIHIPRTLYHC